MNQTIRIIWMLDSSMQTMFRDGFSFKTKYLAELSVAESQERLAHFNDIRENLKREFSVI